MPRVRITSQSQALYVGPAPSTGYHFIDSDGNPTSDLDATNLLKQLNGLQSLDYDIVNNRIPISELGTRQTVKRAIITPPAVNVNFSYIASDLKNEIRMGFDVNFHTGYSWTDPFYANNTGIFCLSGMLSRESYPVYSGFNTVDDGVFTSAWPYSDRDKRNLFLGIAPEGADMKDIPDEEYEKIHCVSFGDCHLSRYDVEFSLNSPIVVNTSYQCANIQYHSSGSGFIPAMNTTDFTPVNNNIFKIPKLRGEVSGNVSGVAEPLRIGDMNLRITAPQYGTEKQDILDAGINYRDLSIQNASISIEINRYAWKGLGHKLPIDRPVKYPITVTTKIKGLVGETQTGDLYNFISKDYPYDLIFECKAPTMWCPGFEQDVRVRYDVIGSNLDNFSFTNQVNQGREVELNYVTDVAEGVGGKGIFMSGMVFETGFAFSGFNF
jgi:hypothetical protein